MGNRAYQAMLFARHGNSQSQFYFTRQDRAVNAGRIPASSTDIRPRVPEAATNAVLLHRKISLRPILRPRHNRRKPCQPRRSGFFFWPTMKRFSCAFFAKERTGAWNCDRLRDDVECKEGCSLRNFGKPASHYCRICQQSPRAGICFSAVKGEKKPPPRGQFRICGLADDRFTVTDHNKFSQTTDRTQPPLDSACRS